jgi:hypothetical protein
MPAASDPAAVSSVKPRALIVFSALRRAASSSPL